MFLGIEVHQGRPIWGRSIGGAGEVIKNFAWEEWNINLKQMFIFFLIFNEKFAFSTNLEHILEFFAKIGKRTMKINNYAAIKFIFMGIVQCWK